VTVMHQQQILLIAHARKGGLQGNSGDVTTSCGFESDRRRHFSLFSKSKHFHGFLQITTESSRFRTKVLMRVNQQNLNYKNPDTVTIQMWKEFMERI